jgi:TRAP-type C4-dicarboxylate transport system permease small subunit
MLAALEMTTRQSWKILIYLVAACLLQQVLWRSWPAASHQLVGVRDSAVSIPFALLLAVWTLGLAGLAIFAIEGVSSRLGQRGPTVSTGKSTSSAQTASMPAPQ